jgi:polysaccharide export outer membrane protein
VHWYVAAAEAANLFPEGNEAMSSRMFVTVVLALLASVTAASAQDILPQGPLSPVIASQVQTLEGPHPRYQILQGDVIELSFPFTPEFNQTVAVHPDGFVTLRVLGDVKVSGMTAPELTTMLEKEYSTILKDPMITVVLKEFQKPAFTASGEIGRPGKYEMTDDLTLSQAVAIAGGLTADAKHSQVLLFRRSSSDWVEVRKVDLKKLLNGDLAEDFNILPGDMLYVPRKKISSIKAYLPITALRLGVGPF